MAPVFPFLTGCERSGTTMLRAMLDAHPDVAIPDESHFLPVLIARRAVLEAADGVDVDLLVALLAASPGFRRWQLDLDALRARFEASPPRDLAEAVHGLYREYADEHGAVRYADKTTTYVFELVAIARLLPEARFAHLVRDGRNAALSLLQVPWGPQTVEEAATWWRVRVQAARDAGALLGPQRYTEVRFESLVRESEAELVRLAEFFDLTWDDGLLRWFERSHAVVDTMPTRRQTTHRNLGRPPSANLRDWRREMPSRDQLLFEVLAGDLLDDLGYPRLFPSVAVLSEPEERRALLETTRRQRRSA